MKASNKSLSLALLSVGSITLLLGSCLHEPTETVSLSSLSSNLHIYEEFDNINYSVRATAILIEEDPVVPGDMLVGVQQVDSNANLKYLTVTDRVVIYDTINVDDNGDPVYIYEDQIGNASPMNPTTAELVGKVPLLNCNDNNRGLENRIGSPCLENVFLVGDLRVSWQDVGDLVEPVSNAVIPVLQETWVLQLTEADENFLLTGTNARINLTSRRYISQSSQEENAGELFVHAYENKTISGVNEWVAVNPDLTSVIAKVISDPSPIDGSDLSVNITHAVYSGCDGASSLNNCVRVANATKNMTYQVSDERRDLTNIGNVDVQVITLSGGVTRAASAIGVVDLGYDVFSNCSPSLTYAGVSFKRTGVTYTGSIAMFADVGAVQLKFICNASYDVSYGAANNVAVTTTVRVDAKMINTSIPLPR